MKTALLVVDVQNDFLPNGKLPALQGNKIIPVINKLSSKFETVIATKDWHPIVTTHFNKWPEHCLQKSTGSEFPKELDTSNFKKIFVKGTGNLDNGYSAFEVDHVDLTSYLKENNIDTLFIVGLTAEYCILSTVIDSVKNGFKTFVIKDAIEGIRQNDGDFEDAIEEMENVGAIIINSEYYLSYMRKYINKENSLHYKK